MKNKTKTTMMVMAILSVVAMLTPLSDTLASTPGVSLTHYTTPSGYCYWNASQSFTTSFTFSSDTDSVGYGVSYPSDLEKSEWTGCNDKSFSSATINLSQKTDTQTLSCTLNISSASESNQSKTCSGFDFSSGKTIGVWIDVKYADSNSYTTSYETFTVV